MPYPSITQSVCLLQDANVVSVVKEPGTLGEPGTLREPETPKGRHHTLGCCTLLKVKDYNLTAECHYYTVLFQRKAKRAYAILASYRPVRGTTVSLGYKYRVIGHGELFT